MKFQIVQLENKKYCVGKKVKGENNKYTIWTDQFEDKKPAQIKLLELQARELRHKLSDIESKWDKLTNNGKDVDYIFGIHFVKKGIEIMKNEYRIDRAYNKIYKLNESGDTYHHLCSFYQIDVCAKDSDAKILSAIEEYEQSTCHLTDLPRQ